MSKNIEINGLNCPLPISKHDKVQLSHGSGGKMMNELISSLFLATFDNPILNKRDDQAILELNGQRIAFSTDSFVVDPLFFPGGDIGELAVNGTVNDVAMSGAKPLFLSCGLIIEEGFSLQELQQVIASMQNAAKKAGVVIVTGDTKVVNKGKGDKLFINTAGIGIIEHPYQIGSANIKEEDMLIVSGTIADHGMTIMSQREGLRFDAPIKSDTAALNGLIADILKAGGADVHAMRDPTRGGLAAALNEFAEDAAMTIKVMEQAIPVNKAVKGACEIMGLDPLYVANEGKLVVSVARQTAKKVLEAMQNHPLGKESAIIGTVLKDTAGMVTMQTRFGTSRIVDMLVGEQLPRIC